MNAEAFLFIAVRADFDALLVDDCIDEARASELKLVRVENSQRSARNTSLFQSQSYLEFEHLSR